MSDSETDTEHTGGGPTRRRQTRKKSGDKLTRSLPPLEASLDGSITHICNEVRTVILRLIDEQQGETKKRLCHGIDGCWGDGVVECVTIWVFICDRMWLYKWRHRFYPPTDRWTTRESREKKTLIDGLFGDGPIYNVWQSGSPYVTECDYINGDIILNIPLTFKFKFSIDELEIFFSQPDSQ